MTKEFYNDENWNYGIFLFRICEFSCFAQQREQMNLNMKFNVCIESLIYK